MFGRRGLRRLQEGLLPPGSTREAYPRRLNLACGSDYRDGWTNVDLFAPRVDRRVDLFRPPWPLPDAGFDYVVAEQFLEHAPPQIGGQDGLLVVLGEIHRILRPGGLLYAGVPYAGHLGDLENVTHYRRFVTRSLDFLDPARENLGGLRHQTPARFRIARCVVLRSVRLTRHFDSSYHLPKYVGVDPNVGRKRGLKFLLERLSAERRAGAEKPQTVKTQKRVRRAVPP